MCTHLDVLQKLLPVPFDLLQLLGLAAAQLPWVWRENQWLLIRRPPLHHSAPATPDSSHFPRALFPPATLLAGPFHSGLGSDVTSSKKPSLTTLSKTQSLPTAYPALCFFCPSGYRLMKSSCLFASFLFYSLHSQFCESRNFNSFAHSCILSTQKEPDTQQVLHKILAEDIHPSLEL